MNKYAKYIKAFADFPKKDVVFWDFTPLHENPTLFKSAISEISNYFEKNQITKIAAIEAKGFVVGSALAYQMNLPLVLIRKPGLIPDKTFSEKFEKEYGHGEYEIKEDAANSEDRILIIYDILAGPGATEAAVKLVQKTGAKVVGCAYVIELEYLHGREKLSKFPIFSLVKIKEKNLHELENN